MYAFGIANRTMPILLVVLFAPALATVSVPLSVLFDNTAEHETALSAVDFYRGKFVPNDEPTPTEGAVLLRAGKFEGDIDGHSPPSDGHFDSFRNAIRSDQYRWPSSDIPYTISSRYSSYSRARIAAAMDEYADKTCIKFVSRSTQSDYVHIMPDKGCYSMVGRVGGRQVVSLGYGCIHKGIIIHELMHAVGFYHEQSRTDRDEHVEVVWRNIQPGMEGQFSKYTLGQIRYLRAPYDYGSIMHYGPRDFSVNGQATLIPTEKGAEIGQRKGFSEVDTLKLNRLYECETSVATAQPTITTTAKPQIKCENLRDDCATLSSHNYCRYAKQWMETVCARACGFCTATTECKNAHPYCHAWSEKKYCHHRDYKLFLKAKCQKSCGYCQ